MKNKGFTLVELLAVIAIIAVLSLVALPNIIDSFNNSKKNNFVSEARQIYKAAKNQYVLDKPKGIDTYEHNSSLADAYTGNELDVSSRNGFGYYVVFNSYGDIVYLYVKDENYLIELGVNNAASDDKIQLSDIVLSKVENISN